MSFNRNKIRLWVIALGVIGAAAQFAAACGPWLPNIIIARNDKELMEMPPGDLYVEFQAIADRLEPMADLPKAVPPTNHDYFRGEDYYCQTKNVATSDLTAALKAGGDDEKRIAEIISAYSEVRTKWQEYGQQLYCDTEKYTEKDNYVPPPAPDVAIPDGLPEEFAIYIRGAAAYYRRDLAAARRAWADLLAMPKEKRQYRTTWAAYMIARSYVGEDDAKAIEKFREVRRLAATGFRDSLGLAAASLGWEARAELNRKNYVEAIHLYLQQIKTGEPTAMDSLRITANKAFLSEKDVLEKIVTDPIALEVLTALTVSEGGPPVCGYIICAESLRPALLNAINGAGIKSVPNADRLAWVAYKAGDMEVTRRWLDKAGPDSLIGKWLKAKLLLRDGKTEQAAAILASLVEKFPRKEVWKNARYYLEEYYIWPASEIAGELAVLKLGREQYTEALDLLLRNDWMLDAGYIADNVLTVEELEKYVLANWKEPDPENPPKHDSPGLNYAYVATKIRHLLARRLCRLERFKDAREFYPPEFRKNLDDYAASLRNGRDESLSAGERAKHLMRAARLARWKGMELLGTELSPDFACYDGRYEYGTPLPQRQEAGRKLTAAGKDEVTRVHTYVVSPNKRFHYRYIAATLAWDAAELLPDNDDETAECLWEGGMWIQNNDPKAADIFYKALVNRCGKTELGAEADKLRWFPKRKLPKLED